VNPEYPENQDVLVYLVYQGLRVIWVQQVSMVLKDFLDVEVPLVYKVTLFNL
jgi:hypothetical protein